jgi:hypothetical protein
MASSTEPATGTMSAPYPRVASTLGSAAVRGMKTVAARPRKEAARATAWPWLPADAATTPAVEESSREMRL